MSIEKLNLVMKRQSYIEIDLELLY